MNSVYHVVVIQEAEVAAVHIIIIIRIIVVIGPDMNVIRILTTGTLDQVLVYMFLTNT